MLEQKVYALVPWVLSLAYVRQIAALTIGALIPVVANLVLVSPTAPSLDLTPVAPCRPPRPS